MPDSPGPDADRLRFEDVDVWAMTDTGSVRETNEDHYFAGSVFRGISVDRTSLDSGLDSTFESVRLASLGVVADGVGGSNDGEQAARIAVRALVQEVSRSFGDVAQAEEDDPEAFSRFLQNAALACHESLLQKAEQEGEGTRFATTLTLFLGLWPQAYLLQVGDSRCYIYQDSTLTQITRDQTWAQDLIDSGALSQTKAQDSHWSNILSSSIGGPEATPVVTRIERDWGAVILLCSDGLTKHVSDQRIQERIESMISARQLCEDLVEDALDDGGTDNITVIVGRTLRREG